MLWRDKVTRYGDRKILNTKWAGPGRVVRTSGPLILWIRATAPPYRERQTHVNDVKPYVIREEVQFPAVEEWEPDYVDPFLDEEAEPGQGDDPAAAALELWWDDEGTRELVEPEEDPWALEMEEAFHRLMAPRSSTPPIVTVTAPTGAQVR